MIIMALPSRYCSWLDAPYSVINALIRSYPGPIHAPAQITQ
jgi:hypothetical protein